MTRKSLTVMWLAIGLLVASWFFPLATVNYSTYLAANGWTSHQDYRPVLLFEAHNSGTRVDYPRILTLDGIILLVATGLLFTFRRSN